VSPAFDLLFLANLAWPLLLLPGLADARGTGIDFWQIYFLTTPHRWITLLLVAFDPDRRDGRPGRFVLYAALLGMLVAGAYLTTGEFLCLALVDAVWNGWHFASQHAGVSRMYIRKVGGGPQWLERHGLRWFIFYVTLRMLGWTTGWTETDPAARQALGVVDLVVLGVPVALLAVAWSGASRERAGRLAYVSSVCLLYGGLLVALQHGYGPVVLALAAGSACFHAVEYLAIVTHYSWRRQTVGSSGLFRTVAGRWLAFLFLYIALLGVAGSWMARPSSGLLEVWVGLNLWAALVHYTYDGMIWKLRRPATAQALGVDGGQAPMPDRGTRDGCPWVRP
jgi:hypothetical protein